MDEQQAYARIGSALAGITSHTMTGAFTTGSFAYTPDQLRDLAKEWTELALDYDRSAPEARRLAKVEGPGTEFASQSHASVVRRTGEAYRRSLEEKRDYCLAQAQKFQNTLDDYLGLERRAISLINNADPQGGI